MSTGSKPYVYSHQARQGPAIPTPEIRTGRRRAVESESKRHKDDGPHHAVY